MPLALEFLPADVLGLSALERSVLAGQAPRELTGLLFPRRLPDVPAPLERLSRDERLELVGTLERELSALGAHVRVLDSARKLATPGAGAVLYTHSASLLGGPLGQLYGALHAVRLAAELERHLAVPLVAVLLIHDGELPRPGSAPRAQRARFLNANLDLASVGLSSVPEACVLARIRLDAELHRLGAVAAHLRDLVYDGPHTARALELFLPRPGETVAQSVVRALLGLCGHLGLLVIDSDWLAVERGRALARTIASVSLAGLEDAGRAFAQSGGHRRIALDTAAFVASREHERVAPLRAGGEGFRYDGEPGSRTAEELAAEIIARPASWIAGGILRPLVDELTLPVAARVGGADELELLALTAPVRARLGLSPAVFVPRLSCSLVQEAELRSLERLGLEAADALRAAGGLRAAAPEGEGASVAAELQSAFERAAEELLGVRARLRALEPGLAEQLRQAVGDARELFLRLAHKAERVEQNRAGKAERHYRRLNNTLRPDGAPQDLVLTILAAVARHGTGWIDELLAQCEAFPVEHGLVRL